MKACLKKIKTAMRPSSANTELKGKHFTPVSNAPRTITTLSAVSRQSINPGPGPSTTPSISPLKLRHAKCFQSSLDTLHPNLIRKRRQIASPEVKVQPGSLSLAQIRSIPLSVCHIRGQHETRSSYVINAEQIRSKHPPLIKRSRSLSPQILRTTATIDLRSPTLVRSISNCGKPREISSSAKGSVSVPSGWRKSMIPIRSPPPSLRSKSPSAGTPRDSYPRTKSSLIGTPKFTMTTTTPPGMKMKDGNWKLLDNEEDATVSMAMYQQQQRKKAAALSRQQNGGSVPAKTASKSRLFFQALVGGMDIQSRPRSPGTQFREYQERKAAAKGKMLPRQQVHPLPAPVPPQKPTSLPLYSSNTNNLNYMPSSMQPKFLFRRPLSSASSITSEPPLMTQGPRGFMTRQASGNSSSALFDDDPGIMSEAETSSTGFRRGGKIRSSLPVVRTPSKTLERPLGLVFLQYHNETKRAILPNEITSMDTVKALFVRSFPKQLTLEYLDVMKSKIYIHDNAKDMFYELEDLRDIRDRSVLRLFEPNVNGNGAVPSWDQDQSYFSEPEFDSDFQHQHIHKSKGTKGPFIPPYAYPIGATLPRGRPYSPQVAIPSKIVQTNNVGANHPNLPPPKPQRNNAPTYGLVKRTPVGQVVSPVPSNMIYSPPRPGSVQGSERSTSFPPHGHYAELRARDLYANPDGYISSPERSRYIPSEDPYYNYLPQTRSGSITPVVIDEESRFRMEHMERQLANLTGLVQKALTPLPGPPNSAGPRHHSSSTLPRNIGATNYSLPQQRDYIPSRDFPDERPPPIDKVLSHPKFGKEKSVSFSDDPPELSKQYSPTLHSVEKPTKSAIKSSTLPRMSQDRIVPVQPQQQPLPPSQQQQPNRVHQPQVPPQIAHSYPSSSNTYGTISSRIITPNRELSPEMYNQLRTLQKKAKELKTDVRALRRSVQAQAHTVRETLRDTYLRFRVVALAGNDQWIGSGGDPAKLRLKKDEELYKQEMIKLEKDLSELEATVEELRTQVINKRTRVNMSDVENMALVLSKSSKSVADLKARFPGLHDSMRNQLSYEMDRLVTEERFLKDEPDRLEISLRRCKKLTGTLVTLKRLASVQEQRLPSTDSIRSLPLSPGPLTPTEKMMNRTSGPSPTTTGYVMVPTTYGGSQSSDTGAETQLDALLDELNSQQQQQQPPTTNSVSTLQRSNRLNPPDPPKRLPSYPSTESGGSPVRHHPPLPPKPSKIPPPPPPRSSSKHSPALMSPTSLTGPIPIMDSDTESLNSQDGIGNGGDKLSQRHVELLRKQRLLQDQYIRLQQLQVNEKGLKKTGSDGNLGSGGKLSLLRENNGGGSLTNLAMSNETDIL